MAGSSLIDVELDPEQVGVDGGAHRDSYGSFVRWLLVATVLAALVIGTLDWVVDPTGVTGRTTRWQVADNSAVRSAKLDLYEAALKRGDDPDVVLLGSSRTMKFSVLLATCGNGCAGSSPTGISSGRTSRSK